MLKTLLLGGLCCVVLALATVVQAGEPLLATQLSPENINKLGFGGPDAIAGINDWMLSNGTLCAVISDGEHETGLSLWGGSLVDIGHCQKNNDQWAFSHLLPNLDKALILKPISITANSNASEAQLRVVAQGNGLRVRSIYRVNLARPEQLLIQHELQCLADCPAISMLGVLTLHPHRALTPYTLSTTSPDYAAGFNHLAFDRFDTRSQLRAMLPNDISILLGAPQLDADISYGVQLFDAYLITRRGEKRRLPIFSITHPDYTMQGILSRPPWLAGAGKLGWWEMLQSLLMRLDEGETLQLSQRILIADDSSVASVTNQFYQGPVLRGRVASQQARVVIKTLEGQALTAIKPGADGRFSAIIPSTTDGVSLELLTPWQSPPPLMVDMREGDVDLGSLAVDGETFVRVTVDKPARVVFKGINTEDPKFYDPLMGFTVGGEAYASAQTVNYISLAGNKLRSGWLPIKPGRYQVLASRGIEYGVTTQQLTIKAGMQLALQVQSPAREIKTPAYVAADFHVHSGLSFDSSLAVAERLRSFSAQGGEVLVATEHNRLVDISADLLNEGLEQSMHIVPGVELTGMARSAQVPFTHGHQNVFPLKQQPGQFSGGLPKHEGRRLRTLIETVRRRDSGAIFQLNHPRDFNAPDPDLAYFENLLTGQAYDSSLPLDDEVNRSLIEPDPASGLRDLDVELIEVANGNNYAMYQAVRNDWFSLLSQGEKIFGSANSDSHGSVSLVAIPVNYVALAGSGEDYRQEDFLRSVSAGNFFGTTGPILRLRARAGDKVVSFGGELAGGDVSLEVTVMAASWVPVSTLKLYINGELEDSWPVTRGKTLTLPVKLVHDSYLVLEVTGKPGEIYRKLAPGFKPFAFSNPVFVDADNDGHWHPAASRAGAK